MARTPRDIIDMVTRDLAREAPAGFFGLAGLPVPPSSIRYGDSSIILPELQADKVLVVDGPPSYALYPEFQKKKPGDMETMQFWPLKRVGLTRHLKMPVCLVVFYLHRGDRATFPESFSLGMAPLETTFRFPTVRLWEKQDEIRLKYPELAALLLITAEEPTEATLVEVKGLIDGLEEPVEKRDNLYGLAAMLGLHYFEQALVQAVFGPKFEEIRKMGVIDRWMDEKYQEGVTQGISLGIREVALSLLADKFGKTPPEVVERIQRADENWCRNFTLLIARARSLEELDLS
ncbi:MAG TPA: hypothetical protein VFJ58_18505 [Armatimonadota bacterium]|nr:hypothetical protein [Armatimonadota bacterium]